MRLDFTFHPDEGYAEIVHRGVITADSVILNTRKMMACPDWRPQFDRLILYDEDALFGDVDPAALNRVTEFVSAELAPPADRPAIRSAHVCTDPVKRTIISYWISLVRDTAMFEARLFSAREDAVAWLRASRSRDGAQAL